MATQPQQDWAGLSQSVQNGDRSVQQVPKQLGVSMPSIANAQQVFDAMDRMRCEFKDEMTSVKAEVAALNKDLVDVKQDVTALKDDTTVHKGLIADVKEDINTLQDDVETAQDGVNILRDDVNTTQEGVDTLEDDLCNVPEDVTAIKEDIKIFKEDIKIFKENITGVMQDVASLKETRDKTTDNVTAELKKLTEGADELWLRTEAMEHNAVARTQNSLLLRYSDALSLLHCPYTNEAIEDFPATSMAIDLLGETQADNLLSSLDEATDGNLATKKSRIRAAVGLAATRDFA